MVLFCPVCLNVVTTIVPGDKLKFKCLKCLVEVDASAEDAKIIEDTYQSDDLRDKYATFLEFMASDPCNMNVKADCPKCGRDYTTLARLGPDEHIVKKCRCGYEYAPSK